jgi:hypothetical protein
MLPVLLSVARWACVFALERDVQRRGIMRGYEMTSSANAISIALLGLRGGYRLFMGMGLDPVFRALVVNTSIGYFIIDSIKVALQGKYVFLMHHLISTMFLYNGTVNSAPVVDIAVLLTELSTPFLHYVTWARTGPALHSVLPASLIFAILFFVTRCILLPWAVYKYWNELNWIRIPYSILIVVNMYWFTKIVRMILRAR